MQVWRSAASISGFTGTGTIADEQQGLPEGIHWFRLSSRISLLQLHFKQKLLKYLDTRKK